MKSADVFQYPVKKVPVEYCKHANQCLILSDYYCVGHKSVPSFEMGIGLFSPLEIIICF